MLEEQGNIMSGTASGKVTFRKTYLMSHLHIRRPGRVKQAIVDIINALDKEALHDFQLGKVRVEVINTFIKPFPMSRCTAIIRTYEVTKL